MIQHVTLHPSRIGCPSIPGTMKGIVMSIPGVQDVRVRYDDRSLDIVLDDEKVSVDTIIKRIGQEMGLAMEQADKPGSKKDGNGADTCPM